MEKWLESVYSDGSPQFVVPPLPKMKERVSIRLQVYNDAKVRHIFLRTVPNGAECLTEMHPLKETNGLTIYEASIEMTEPRMNYQFHLVTEDTIYYYTQNGITTYIPDHTYDFVLLADYVQPEWVKSQVFYQIFPERFCNGTDQWPMEYDDEHKLDFYGGTLDGIREKIPYLKDLGVTAVYLNPIFEAPSTHKYDCSDYTKVDAGFGGDEALARLSKALHENGMKLVLDISINHTGTQGPWFQKALHDKNSMERGFYFFEADSDEYKGWAGYKSLPVLDYRNEELRNRIYRDKHSVLRKWLQPPYSIDGWRFDVADVFARNDEIQLNRPLWREIRTAIREENPQAYILAEDWGDCGTYMQGDEWDAPMNYFGFGRIIRQYLGAGDLFGMRNEIIRNVPYRMTAEDVEARVRQHLAKIPFVFWQNQFNLFDSHDVSRLHHENVDWESYRGAVIFQFMMIGTPSVYYGDELEIEGWTENDGGFRAPMPWNRVNENLHETPFYHLYQTLSHRKCEYSSLCEGSMKFLCAEKQVIALARFDETQAHVMVMNHNDTEITMTIPFGAIGLTKECGLEEVFSEEPKCQWSDERNLTITIPAHKTYLFYGEKMQGETK